MSLFLWFQMVAGHIRLFRERGDRCRQLTARANTKNGKIYDKIQERAQLSGDVVGNVYTRKSSIHPRELGGLANRSLLC